MKNLLDGIKLEFTIACLLNAYSVYEMGNLSILIFLVSVIIVFLFITISGYFIYSIASFFDKSITFIGTTRNFTRFSILITLVMLIQNFFSN